MDDIRNSHKFFIINMPTCSASSLTDASMPVAIKTVASIGNALQFEVLCFKQEMFLVDAGLGTPRICMQDKPTGVPINRATRFENRVGFLDLVVVAVNHRSKSGAAGFNDLVGSTDVVVGEPLLLLPRRFAQNRAWMELNKIELNEGKDQRLYY
ncbi:hypothetical protein H5410_036430 [Solanum commersonii]|uniref:Uncharacterized protein n=1 Tax=Solanum commersonii TaxID=4109 RepID=A0A9J5Y848_SOLCO|nr:hypothetical protein H5410_036430 [Solanum commersonii]